MAFRNPDQGPLSSHIFYKMTSDLQKIIANLEVIREKSSNDPNNLLVKTNDASEKTTNPVLYLNFLNAIL